MNATHSPSGESLRVQVSFILDFVNVITCTNFNLEMTIMLQIVINP